MVSKEPSEFGNQFRNVPRRRKFTYTHHLRVGHQLPELLLPEVPSDITVAAIKDQSRHVDGRDNVTDIRLLNHAQVMGRRARARREAAEVDPPIKVLTIHAFFDLGGLVIPLAPAHPRLTHLPGIRKQ